MYGGVPRRRQLRVKQGQFQIFVAGNSTRTGGGLQLSGLGVQGLGVSVTLLYDSGAVQDLAD